MGAKHVDAVEIDPLIQHLGVELHPDRPYQDPRVSVHINDGRAFLERTDNLYDLILFALPDSLTLVSAQSVVAARELPLHRRGSSRGPTPSETPGVFAMYNFYRERWIVDRLGRTLEMAFGRPPCLDTVGGVGHLALLTVGADPTVGDLSPRLATGDRR
jgi:hypothetical protein